MKFCFICAKKKEKRICGKFGTLNLKFYVRDFIMIRNMDSGKRKGLSHVSIHPFAIPLYMGCLPRTNNADPSLG